MTQSPVPRVTRTNPTTATLTGQTVYVFDHPPYASHAPFRKTDPHRIHLLRVIFYFQMEKIQQSPRVSSMNRCWKCQDVKPENGCVSVQELWVYNYTHVCLFSVVFFFTLWNWSVLKVGTLKYQRLIVCRNGLSCSLVNIKMGGARWFSHLAKWTMDSRTFSPE